MSQIAEFVTQPSGRIQVVFGMHTVGFIEPYDAVCRGGSCNVGAYFWIALPLDGGGSPKRPAANVRIARRLILHRLAGWYEAAGPEFSRIASALALQAESERAVA